MLRLLITLVMIALPEAHIASAQHDERTHSDMPVIVLYCDEDPGRIQAGGGKDPAPESLVESGLCTPAAGVALTFVLADDDWNFEEDDLATEVEWNVQEDGWFNRCDTDAEGFCTLNSPTGFDIVIGVVLHEGTVLPGYEPAFFQRGTHNFTEFAGFGLALVPTDAGATPDANVADHQTLALNIIINGEPGAVLTEWAFNGEHNDTYLATNAGGWVSTVISANDDLDITLVNIDDDADISLVCAANDDTNVTVSYQAGNHGDLQIQIPDTVSDIRCDVSISD